MADQKGKNKGLGDAIHEAVLKSAAILPSSLSEPILQAAQGCGACAKRREWLNKAWRWSQSDNAAESYILSQELLKEGRSLDWASNQAKGKENNGKEEVKGQQ